MNPDSFYTRIVAPTLDYMAASPSINVPVSASARVLVMAIAGQEGRWKHRRQVGIGQYNPQQVGARSCWQGEKTGGMILSVHHPETATKAAALLQSLDISEPNLNQWVMPTDQTIYEAIAWQDTLACGLARLLLWTDPAPLPDYWDKAAGWQYYERLWRPGAPHPETWSALHDQAMAAVGLPPK